MHAQLRPLFAASAKMFYRSLDTVWFAAVSPFLLLAIFTLVKNLHYGVTHSTGTINFFTFTAIGFAAFIAAHFNQDGIVGTASGYRAQGVLKRIAATPISPTVFIVAQVLVRLAVGLVQTIAFLVAAAALGVHIHHTPELLLILPVAAIVLLTGTGFGFAIAGATRSPEAANQLNITLFTPVFLLAGVQYPLQGLPGPLPQIAKYAVPFASPIQLFRDAVGGHLGGDLAYLGLASIAWLAAALVLAVRSYRLDERAV